MRIDTGRRTHRDDRPVCRILRIIRAFAEGSFVALGFVFAILAVGIPVALAARAVHAVALWLAGDGMTALGRSMKVAAPVAGTLAAAAMVATSFVLFFAWRRGLMSGQRSRTPRPREDQPRRLPSRPGPHAGSLGTADAVSPS